jgi:hypothetical protein
MAFESSDAKIRPIVLSGVVLAVGAAFVSLLVYGLFRMWRANPPDLAARPYAGAQNEFPPPPRLLEHPELETQELRRTEREQLSSYGWIDRSKGIVRVPIGRAMELQLQRGFPVGQEDSKQ